MCGIAGLVDPRLTEAELRRRVELMVETLYHRGPDDAGIFVGVHAAIGMRRLSIIDVAGGSQPLANEDASVHVVCNGEIYNFPELARELRRRGHRFRTRSDVETIPHAYEDDPRRFVERVGGMFAFALWDEKARRLTLARDRLGKKPLYYAEIDGALAFASEIKALLACDPRLREPDPAAARWYVRYGFVPEPLTMFARIRVLPPAHELVFEGGRCRLRRYWQLPDEQAEHVTHTEARERLDALLRESVTSRLVSDVPLGIFLSGGIDSSAVAAYAQAGSTSALKTFTIGFDRPAWDESPDARVVAEHLGTDHHVLRLTEAELTSDLPDTLLRIVRHVDQPFADPSALPMYHVSRLRASTSRSSSAATAVTSCSLATRRISACASRSATGDFRGRSDGLSRPAREPPPVSCPTELVTAFCGRRRCSKTAIFLSGSSTSARRRSSATTSRRDSAATGRRPPPPATCSRRSSENSTGCPRSWSTRSQLRGASTSPSGSSTTCW